MKKPVRSTMALALAVIYMAITISPLAPLGMRSKVVVHALTGECSGDCDTCGCSPERTANHTCCCYLKKRIQQREESKEHAAQCLNTSHDGAKTKTGIRNQVPECCREKQSEKKEATLSCDCPCGKGRLIALWGAEKYEMLPYRFADDIPHPLEEVHHHHIPQRLTSRYCEPPDPPPKLSILSG